MLAGAVAPADREIEIGFGEVHRVIGRNQHEAQLAVSAGDLGEARHQPFLGQVARRGDGQRLGGLSRLHGADGFLELEEAMTERGKPSLTLRGQLKALGGAAEQDDTKRVFQSTNLLAHRCRGNGEFVGGTREGQVPRGRVEHAQAVEWEVSTLHAPTAGASSANLGISTSNADPSSPSI